jgi:predicted component of type VI protein secretion system
MIRRFKSGAKLMYRFTLEWLESSQLRSKTVSVAEVEQLETIFRIGRDEQQCDIVVNDETSTVSRLHAEILFKSEDNRLYLRNFTGGRSQPNLVIVDRQKILNQEIVLHPGSEIQLGKLKLKVKLLKIALPSVSQPQISQPQVNQPSQQQEYGLQCINGHQVSYDHVGLFCPFCGTALQAVDTVIIARADQPA